MKRQLKQSVKVLVEGYTEKYYVSGLKSKTTTELNIEPPVNMKGKGYTNFIKEIKKLDHRGCIAIFIIVDLDNAASDRGNLDKLINLCKSKTNSTKIPYFLIGTNHDFEYFSCCHSSQYNTTDTKKYIVDTFGYKDWETYKSDINVYTKLNTSPYCYSNALDKTKGHYLRNETFLKNTFTKNKKSGISINLTKTSTNDNALSYRHSNLIEFFEIIGLCNIIQAHNAKKP